MSPSFSGNADQDSADQAKSAMQRMAARLLGGAARAVAIDETEIAFRMLDAANSPGVMIDVGAHVGGSLAAFVKHGWTVHAFEPDAVNRQRLQQLAMHFRSTLHIDSRAVSDKSRKQVPFYRSDESTGISGLSAFRDSHTVAGTVDTVTLTDYLRQSAVQSVDFLKIDTEGFDLFVLYGFPWETMKPRAIVCEFEDAKTAPLGYSYHDMADFLQQKGYSLLVSEWYPIVRYGAQHRWRRFATYPYQLAEASSWGNLIAAENSAMLEKALPYCGELERRYHLQELTDNRTDP